MGKRMVRAVAAGVTLVLAGCGRGAPHATILYLQARESGGSPFPARVLVNRHFVRIDPDMATGNYILFNRKRRVIYSVDAADRTILVIRSHPVTYTPPILLENRVARLPGSVTFDGHKALHYALSTNGEQCYEVYAAKGFLRGAARALAGYKKALAGEQALAAEQGAPELQGPCGLADSIFSAGREYAQGFPIKMIDQNHNEKTLMRVRRDVAVNRDTFTLPAHYLRYSPNEVRSGS
ncbi:MAG: hypothetical protein M0Z76_06460 [Gammaproteobacteria bacterium]|nr:hypothetical protein [Gammaproteobacteria bacterium]